MVEAMIFIQSKKLFTQRMVARKNEEFQAVHETVHYFAEEKGKKLDYPMVWLVIDEAHERRTQTDFLLYLFFLKVKLFYSNIINIYLK